MSVSDNIKSIRNQKGISQAEVARRLEIEPSSYHRLENRGDKMTLEQVDSVALALGVTRLELLTWGEQTNELSRSVDDGEQQKRLVELEDRLKDKQFIIEKLTKDIKDISKLINAYIDTLKFFVSEYLRVGILHYTDASGNTVSIPYKNITREDYHKLYNDFKDVRVETSSEDEELVIKTMFTDENFSLVASYFMSTGFIEDKELIDAYEKYQSDMTAWIPGFYILKLIDNNSPILRVLEKGGLFPFGGR